MRRPTVILVPGLMCDATVWESQLSTLAGDFNVVIPKLHDHDSLEDMARTILESVGDNFDLVGHSMGGRVAFEIMRVAPERVRSLVVLDTGVHPPTADEPGRRQPFLDIAEKEGIAGVAKLWIPIMIHSDRHSDQDLMNRITGMVTSYSVNQFKGQTRALLSRRDMMPVLPGIHCPTLVAVGRQDAWASVAQHAQIASAIQGSRLEIIEDSGHMVTMERPVIVNDLLLKWLQSANSVAT